jgi:light-regulated signal transduction histidine kinase (bacteriophytochrome)
MIKKGGVQFWGRLEGVVNKGPDGQPITRMVLSDVTKREELLLNANKVLEDAHHELQSFNYSISHDLKSPLNTIISFCNIIIKDHHENLNTDAQQLFSRVVNATKRMASVLDGLLEISRISRAELKREEFDLSLLVQTLAAEFQAQEPNRKIKFLISKEIKITGDARLLTVVMSNLINNAFKFTANKSEAVIEFGVIDIDGNKTYFLRDNGAGFDMRHYGKLFTPFERLHSNSVFAGTGVGLASVQRVIQRHNGDVWAEGSIDIGATFYFSFK